LEEVSSFCYVQQTFQEVRRGPKKNKKVTKRKYVMVFKSILALKKCLMILHYWIGSIILRGGPIPWLLVDEIALIFWQLWLLIGRKAENNGLDVILKLQKGVVVSGSITETININVFHHSLLQPLVPWLKSILLLLTKRQRFIYNSSII